MNDSLLVVYSNLGLGGMPKRLIDILNSMADTHPRVPVYVLLKEARPFDMRSSITNPGVTILDFCRWSPFDSAPIFILWVWLFVLIKNPKTILSFISPYALPVLATKMLFFWRKTRVVVNEGHFTSTMISSMMLPAVQALGIRLLYPMADALIVPTRVIKTDLTASYGIKKETITVVPNWTAYAADPLYKGLRLYDIVYAGRIDKTKNIVPLLKMVPGLIKVLRHPVRFMLIGDGPDRERCARYISLHDLSKYVFIHPPVTNIDYYLRRTKIFIFNPDRSTEGFPVAMLDAMACGAVVITSRFDGAEEVINKKNGFIATSGEEFINYIKLVLNNRTRQSSRILRAKKLVISRHSLENVRLYTRLFCL